MIWYLSYDGFSCTVVFVKEVVCLDEELAGVFISLRGSSRPQDHRPVRLLLLGHCTQSALSLQDTKNAPIKNYCQNNVTCSVQEYSLTHSNETDAIPVLNSQRTQQCSIWIFILVIVIMIWCFLLRLKVAQWCSVFSPLHNRLVSMLTIVNGL